MRPGTTVFEWIQDHDVRSIGIDVRRFASFGVIKVPPIHFTRAPMHLTFVWVGPPSRRRTAHRDEDNDTASLAHRRATSLTVPPLASLPYGPNGAPQTKC
jgi:hypothetical protein